MAGVGKLSFTVWPVYVGAANDRGEEPISSFDYGRGMIHWDIMPNGELVGRSKILVPAGDWNYILYCQHPTQPIITAAQKLDHPLVLPVAGEITLDCITEKDINPLLTPEQKETIRQRLANSRNEGLFTPPSIQGSVELQGHNGGANWGSSAGFMHWPVCRKTSSGLASF